MRQVEFGDVLQTKLHSGSHGFRFLSRQFEDHSCKNSLPNPSVVKVDVEPVHHAIGRLLFFRLADGNVRHGFDEAFFAFHD